MKNLSNLRFALLENRTDRELRYRLSQIVFKDGYAWATNGYILFKSNIKNFTHKPHLLEGKAIHYDTLVKMSKCKIVHMDDKGDIYGDGKILEFIENPDINLDYENILNRKFEGIYQSFALDLDILSNLNKCFIIDKSNKNIKNTFKFEFPVKSENDKNNFPSRPIKVTRNKDNNSFSVEYDEIGIIMPVFINP